MNPTKELKNVEVGNVVFDESIIEINNNKVFIKAHNPHGFYKITFERGRVPESLQGGYTSRSMAEAEARKYFLTKSKEMAA